MVLCTGMEIYKVSFCFLGLYCNNSFCFRASDSFCLRLLDILRTPALNLCRVIVPLSLSFSFFFSYFLNHSFTVVSARSWYTAPLVTTTIV